MSSPAKAIDAAADVCFKASLMRSRMFPHLGAMLHYQIGGVADGPTIVLLHGGLGSIQDFAPLLPRLLQRFRVVAVDSRGQGCSTLGQASLTYAQLAEDALHILRAAGVDRYSLLGFSDGGTVAYRLGIEQPGVERVITIGAQWHVDSLGDVREIYAAVNVDFIRKQMPDQFASYSFTNPEPNLSKLADQLKAMWLDTSDAGYPNEAIGRIRVPVLAMRGDNDPLFSAADLEALEHRVPTAQLRTIAGAAHEAMREQPDLVWNAMSEFWP